MPALILINGEWVPYQEFNDKELAQGTLTKKQQDKQLEQAKFAVALAELSIKCNQNRQRTPKS